jgi:3-methyladenine DNA glycosylase AlkD
MSLSCEEVLKKMKKLSDKKALAGMAKFGINRSKAYGVSIPNIRKMAKEIGTDHELAQQLWSSGIHEARILAGMADNPEKVNEQQMESWVKDFDSWDVYDQVCSNLLDKTEFANKKVFEFSKRKEEFEKRTAFVLMACLAVHDKKASDETFLEFLPIIKRESTDERNFVRKAVNWALRQIGKRNAALNKEAIKAAKEIQKMDSKSAKWIANDALRELTSPAVQKRLNK